MRKPIVSAIVVAIAFCFSPATAYGPNVPSGMLDTDFDGYPDIIDRCIHQPAPDRSGVQIPTETTFQILMTTAPTSQDPCKAAPGYEFDEREFRWFVNEWAIDSNPPGTPSLSA